MIWDQWVCVLHIRSPVPACSAYVWVIDLLLFYFFVRENLDLLDVFLLLTKDLILAQSA